LEFTMKYITSLVVCLTTAIPAAFLAGYFLGGSSPPIDYIPTDTDATIVVVHNPYLTLPVDVHRFHEDTEGLRVVYFFRDGESAAHMREKILNDLFAEQMRLSSAKTVPPTP